MDVPEPPVKVTFADGERLIPFWQNEYLTGDEIEFTYEAWVDTYVNQRMLRRFVEQAVPFSAR